VLGAVTGAALAYGFAYAGPLVATQLARFLPASIISYFTTLTPPTVGQLLGGGASFLGIFGAAWLYEKSLGSQPDPTQEAKIQNAVNIILADVTPELESHRQKLRNGEMEFKVWTDPGEDGSWGWNPHFASSTVMLDRRFVELCDEKLIAATIVHEVSHSSQLPIWKALPRGEIWAFTDQSDFMKGIGVTGSLSALFTVFGQGGLNIERTYLRDTMYGFEHYGIDDPAITD
jgi:hypothetical protein